MKVAWSYGYATLIWKIGGKSMVIFMLLPIIVSIIIIIYSLKKGFDKNALYISLSIAMVCAMFILKYHNSWIAFFTALTVPFAFIYVLLCLLLSIKEDCKNRRNH